mgnify:CR=1 FL=1
MSRAARSDIIDLVLCLHHETEAAILVSETGFRADAVWLPKAAVEFERSPLVTRIVSLPERLAIDKGLV